MWRPPSLFLQKPREKSSFFIISPIKSILFLNFSGIHLRSTLGISWVKYHLRSILGSFAVSGSFAVLYISPQIFQEPGREYPRKWRTLIGRISWSTNFLSDLLCVAGDQSEKRSNSIIPEYLLALPRWPKRRLWVRDWPTLGRMWIWRGWRPEGAINCENVIRPGSIVTTKRCSQAIRSHLYSASASDWRSVVSGNVSAYGTDNTCWKTSVLTLHNFAL